MKKLILLFLIAKCVTLSGQSNTKSKYTFGIKLGGANCNITGSRIKSPAKGGLEIGFWLQLKISKNWSIQAELLSIKKGAGGFRADRPRRNGEYLLGLSYVEMPILLRYHIKKFSLEFGPGLGVLVSQFEILNGALYPDMTDVYPFTKKEFSFNAGFGYSFNEKWYLGFRFTHSLLPVRKQLPEISEQVYNRAFAITVSRLLKFKKQKTKTKQIEE